MRRQAWIVASFVAFLALGLPVWWQTTTVYRADLPAIPTTAELSTTARLVHALVAAAEAIPDNHWRNAVENLCLVMVAADDDRLGADDGRPEADDGQPGADVSDSSITAPNDIALDVVMVDGDGSASGARVVMDGERSGRIEVVGDGSAVEVLDAVYNWVDGAWGGEAKVLGGLHVAVQLELTLLVDPARGKMAWNPEDMAAWLAPFVARLAPVLELSVASHVVYDVSLGGAVPTAVKGGGSVVDAAQLKHFVNASSWTLTESPRAEVNKTLRLVYYMPSDELAPLRLLQGGPGSKTVPGNAFVIPTWGAITVVAPADGTFDLAPYRGTTLAHLRRLLGLRSPVRGTVEPELGAGFVEPVGSRGAALWEVDALATARVGALTAEAVDAVRQLTELVDSIPNMVVEDHIAADVSVALSLAADARAAAATHGQLLDAVRLATRAHVLADRALFDQSIVGLLYFPDDHKYAIYTPLFVPISLPVVIGVLKELKACIRGDPDE
ncbi:GPI transamidase component PIG-S [Thecamonas trahens ATCC 50062]|uniref:GPI transamidase component PIG-S n=1 Tax=Thecamonas trahens ATCC 50062 TaxID=461836 RepID=A0A0L0DCL5_THETB|nr:GPI transamidase component PIG-S [Thecamonas trahens ATCC 50062]KNC49856.1 GPI transamidase component PIG-S [Thecamonas trahens ATCC 50062]|eukprot:XP_013757341.1 GPI transamidase component PIG-S [Thecamonas trahens ATCC 50062]